jgi:hypothetical protein
MPPSKKEPNTEELMKGFHGVFKALKKMEAMEPGLKPKLTEAKKAMKDAVADVLKGDTSGLDDDDSSSTSTTGSEPPPAAESNTGTPEGGGTPPPTTAS